MPLAATPYVHPDGESPHAVLICCRVKVLVGMEGGSMYDTQWQMSNRCRRCKGQGQMICATCGGLGSRGPSKSGRRQLISK